VSATLGFAYNLGQRFSRIAAQAPDQTALVMAATEEQASYYQLEQLSNRLARELLARGLVKGDVLCLMQQKSVAGYATMLACLKLGVIFLNVDSASPEKRLDSILQTASPKLFVTDHAVSEAHGALLAQRDLETFFLHDEAFLAQLADHAHQPLSETAQVTGADPAYIMFTSGSTGVPKGVVISHANVLNFIQWGIDCYQVTREDIFTNVNPLYFDNSVFDFYTALFSGACLVAFSREITENPKELVTLVERFGCTIWFSVPSMLIYLSTMRLLSKGCWPQMRVITFGGEGFPKPELKKLYDLYSDQCRFVNVYGPTECTCICSAHEIGATDFEEMNALPTLGHLSGNFDYAILDGDLQPVPDGASGELCLMGPNVGIGYYNDPARTQEVFISDPRQGAYAQRMYRTGDQVRLDPRDGYLYFMGRKDRQIKHMGHRIELDEIEGAFNALAYVQQAAVIYVRVSSKFGHLLAYIVAEPDYRVSDEQIRDDLKRTLPQYMVPNRLHMCEFLPKNANGKVNRKQLAEHYSKG